MDLDFGFRVGDCEVLPRQGTLTVRNKTTHLEPKVMGVLVCLARHAGEVVTRDEFLDEVWSDVVVGDAVLSRSIAILRSEFGDDSKEPRYIQTVPKVGYRLVADIRPHDQSGQASRPARLQYLFTIAVLGIALTLLAWWWSSSPGSDIAGPDLRGDLVSMGVIKFDHHGPNSEAFSEGLLEVIMSDLSRVKKLRVKYRADEPDQDPCTAARQMGTQTLLKASVQTDTDRIRVTYQWMRTSNCFLILAKTHERDLGDLFQVQNAISQEIVSRLAEVLQTQLDPPPPLRAPASPEIYPSYVLARQDLNTGRNDLKRRGAEPIQRSIRVFEQAIVEDAAFAPAYLSLAEAYAVLPNYTRSEKELMYAKALEALETLAELDGTPSRTHATRAIIHAQNMEFDEAATMFQQAVDDSPSDGNLRQWYSQYLSMVGYLDRSLEEAKVARDLDQLSPVIIHRLAIAHLWMDEDAIAERYFALAQSVGIEAYVNPEPYLILLLRLQKFDEMRDWTETIQETQGLPTNWVGTVIDGLAYPTDETRQKAVAAIQAASVRGEISARLFWGNLILLQQFDLALEATIDLLQQQPIADELQFLFARETASLRALPRFAVVVRMAGLDRFWDDNGWPASCKRENAEILCH